jgi:hypothetical protein
VFIMKKPNWNKWKYAGELSITEAVLLAMDIDPSEHHYEKGLNVPYDRSRSGRGDAIKEQFHDLTSLATRAVTSTPPRLKFVRDKYSTWTGATFYVKDHDFAKWWKSIGRELPAEFPTHEPEIEGAFSFETDSETYPPELDIAFQAWRAVAVNGNGGSGDPKARIKHWLDTNYPKVSDAAKERISVVCNWEKTGGRKKGV